MVVSRTASEWEGGVFLYLLQVPLALSVLLTHPMLDSVTMTSQYYS